jgi:trehalose/maltose hydrolase-like predicted phosphorylase
MTSGSDPAFPQPTIIVFDRYEPADERRRESLFGLGNGWLFVRSCRSDAETQDGRRYAGTYCAGCYDRHVQHTGADVFAHASLANLPNWLPLTFRVVGDATWFRLEDWALLDYRHQLDMESGMTERRMLVRDGQGRRTLLVERRLVSMPEPCLAALRLELTAENWSGRVEWRQALPDDAANHNTDRSQGLRRHIEAIGRLEVEPGLSLLQARTIHSQVRLALAARLYPVVTEAEVRMGQPIAIEKIVAIVTSRDPTAADPVEKARDLAAAAGDFAALAVRHRAAWARLWRCVGIDARDADVAGDLNFHVFHLLQTISPHSVHRDVGLPSRGWQEAYHGQIFWDEVFAFSFLNHRFSEIARALLLYRYRRLPEARRAAKRAGWRGAMFPWRSATTGGEETPAYEFNSLSGHWLRDNTRLELHIGAIISHNAWHYYLATGDAVFLAEFGAEMMIEIARFWASIATPDAEDGRFDIRGVVGPDEYHDAYSGADRPGLDNNAYTMSWWRPVCCARPSPRSDPMPGPGSWRRWRWTKRRSSAGATSPGIFGSASMTAASLASSPAMRSSSPSIGSASRPSTLDGASISDWRPPATAPMSTRSASSPMC